MKLALGSLSFDQAVLKYSTREETKNQKGQVVNPETAAFGLASTNSTPTCSPAGPCSRGSLRTGSTPRRGQPGLLGPAQLNERFPAHRANPKDDYALFQQQVESELREEALGVDRKTHRRIVCAHRRPLQGLRHGHAVADPKHQRPTLTLRPDAHFRHHGLFIAAATLSDAVQSECSPQVPTPTRPLTSSTSSSTADPPTAPLTSFRPFATASPPSSPSQTTARDAMNKGIRAATGDVVAILNADDVYASNDVLARVAQTFAASGTEAVYGDLNYVAADDLSRVTRRWRAGTYSPGAFRRGWMPLHPSLFVRRTCCMTLGMFNLYLRSAADYELMLRFIHRHGMTLTYLTETLVLMRAGGVGSTRPSTASAPIEDWKAWRMNGYLPPC